MGMVLNPETAGAKLAQVVMGSNVARQNNRIAQMLDAAGVSMGQAGGAADMQARAYANQLGAISMRPAVDPTYSGIVGGLAAAGSIYGAGRNAGWFGNKPLPTSTSYTSFPQQSSSPWIYNAPPTAWS
jgi:hypothetical protein